jgi:hypothetical protein
VEARNIVSSSSQCTWWMASAFATCSNKPAQSQTVPAAADKVMRTLLRRRQQKSAMKLLSRRFVELSWVKDDGRRRACEQ